MLLPDISEFQPNANLPGIRAQNGGAVIMRVGYGHDHLDRVFVNHRVAARDAEFKFVGLYHYVTQDQDVMAQAEQFCSWVGTLRPGEIPVIDMEEGNGDQAARTGAWLSYVDQRFGLDKLPLNRRSWVYSYVSFVGEHNLLPIFQSARRSWIAGYSNTEPGIPHSLWQCNDGAVGPYKTNWTGAGYCDTSETWHTLADLAAMAYQVTVPTQPVNPPKSAYPLPAKWLSTVTLVQGNTGLDVTVLQVMLAYSRMVGVRGITIDGIFGGQTLTAVKNFQERVGLKVDGKAGPLTHDALTKLNDYPV